MLTQGAAMTFDVALHRTLEVICTCGQVHVSNFPVGLNESVQYGQNVRALAVHLTQRQMLPYARAAELIQDLYDLLVSPSTLVFWVDEACVALQGTADVIADLTGQRRRIGIARCRQTALAAHRGQREIDVVRLVRKARSGSNRGARDSAQAHGRAGSRLLGAVLEN
jgi:hypothetical protein